jgi:hypothetical protein
MHCANDCASLGGGGAAGRGWVAVANSFWTVVEQVDMGL